MIFGRPSPLPARLVLSVAVLAVDARADGADLAAQARSILARTCVGCHGPEKQKGGLRLDVRDSTFEGGDSGEPAIKPGDPDVGELLVRITSADETLRMPPQGDRLDAGQVDLLRRWIAGGATWPDAPGGAAGKPSEMVVTDLDRDHWAFRPLGNPEIPALKEGRRAGSPVDRFLLAALDAKGLTPAPEADRRTLIRRVTFDLIGLPPAPEDVEAFAIDESADAFGRLVDRLLDDPRYGERWARHWLDVARYADSNGYENDADRPGAYHYRDFVIRALNRDLPYDVFLRRQLAGDEDPSGDPEAKAATGFLAAGPVVTSDTKLEEELRRYRYDELDDILSTTGAAMLGLTVGCARCHDHKYDPLPTRDYYRALAAFAPTRRTLSDGPLALVDPTDWPEPAWLLNRGDPMARKEEVAPGFLTVLLRGKTAEDYLAEVRRSRGDRPAGTTLRRSAMALWLTDVDHGAGPLAARVMVNRIWQHHFGEGIVRTPGDFGLRGDPPSHPGLLEWLARRFVEEGWSVKRMHRLILASDAYRRGTDLDPKSAEVDPENRLLWRRRPLRLEAEALRDALLAVSGTLNPARFGPGVKPPIPARAMAAYNTKDPYPQDARDDETTRRRSVYLFVKRSMRTPLIEVFDGADPSASCARRIATTVAPQALALLNDDLVRRRARDFARRLLAEADSDGPIARRGFALALGRGPRPEEHEAATAFLRDRAEARARRGQPADEARELAVADFCQALFGLNEFLYVD